jgi:Na+/H+ antiporter NhaD/arsenite permease-like protein
VLSGEAKRSFDHRRSQAKLGTRENLIVVDQAERLGYKITWTDHARYGIPVTLVTLAISGAWIFIL